jgi:hypothetical protein
MFQHEFKMLWVKVLWGVMAAFAALLAGAMLLYPDPAGRLGGYPFFHEFISALGMTKTHQGVPNLLPCILLMLIFAHRDYCGRAYKLGWCAAAAVILLAEGVALALVRHGQWPSRPTNPVIQKINVAVFLLWVAAELILYRRYLAARRTAASQ